jgi:hypothetical protein
MILDFQERIEAQFERIELLRQCREVPGTHAAIAAAEDELQTALELQADAACARDAQAFVDGLMGDPAQYAGRPG